MAYCQCSYQRKFCNFKNTYNDKKMKKNINEKSNLKHQQQKAGDNKMTAEIN